jgi:hypothetical protein
VTELARSPNTAPAGGGGDERQRGADVTGIMFPIDAGYATK